MKRSYCCTLVALVFSGCQALPVAENKSPPPATVESRPVNAALAGQFAGKWTSTDGNAGDLRIKLRQEAGTTWVGEAMFTYRGADIPGKVSALEAEGAKLRLVFDWVIEGTAGQSTLHGELIGDTLKGTYETRSVAGASRGTWSATRG